MRMYSIEEVLNLHKFDLGFDYAEYNLNVEPIVGDYYYSCYWTDFFKIVKAVRENNFKRYTLQWSDGHKTTSINPVDKYDYHIYLAKPVSFHF